MSDNVPSSQVLAEIAQKFQQQQAQICELQHQLAQATAAAAASSSSVAAPNHHSNGFSANDTNAHKFSLDKLLSRPTPFHGEDGQRVFDFCDEIEIIMRNCSATTPESRKISFVQQLLKGEALRWYLAREKSVQNHECGADGKELTALETWAQFKQTLLDQFGGHGASEVARRELHQLRQNQFRDLGTYADRFETLSRRIMTPPGTTIQEELISAFKEGLSDGQIRLHITTAKPKSLFEAIELARQAEYDLYIARARPNNFQQRKVFSRSRQEYQRFSYNSNHQHYPFRQYNPTYPSNAGPNHQASFRSDTIEHAGHNGPTPMDLGIMSTPHHDWRFTPQTDSEANYNDDSNESIPGEPATYPYHKEERRSPSDSYPSSDGRRFSSSSMDFNGMFQPYPRNHYNNSYPRQPVICYRCRRPGHMMVDCPADGRNSSQPPADNAQRYGNSMPNSFRNQPRNDNRFDSRQHPKNH